MVVLSDASAEVSTTSEDRWKHLRPYQFKRGHVKLGGRKVGSRDALNVILDAAPRKARQYVKSTAPAVLVDSRKWIMPIESDRVAPAGPERMALILFFEQQLRNAIPSASESTSLFRERVPLTLPHAPDASS